MIWFRQLSVECGFYRFPDGLGKERIDRNQRAIARCCNNGFMKGKIPQNKIGSVLVSAFIALLQLQFKMADRFRCCALRGKTRRFNFKGSPRFKTITQTGMANAIKAAARVGCG